MDAGWLLSQGAVALTPRVSGWDRQGGYPDRKDWEKKRKNGEYMWDRVARQTREREERVAANRARQRQE